MRILLVEDEIDQAELFAGLLSAHGTVTSVHSVREALALIQSETAAFDLAVVNLGMLDGVGFDVVEALQKRWGNQRIRVVLTTGAPDEGVSERARELGIEAVLFKPFPLAELHRFCESR